MSGFGTASAELHRTRRGAMNRFFSKASTASRANVVQNKLDKLCQKLEACHASGEIVSLDAAFICLTMDIITELAYGTCFDFLGMVLLHGALDLTDSAQTCPALIERGRR